ncbi:hypothetical protein ACRALDRAFT_1059497 [Sodiomyces alcalophilus JCM 7366]|uniref:uncharacterized protein n=1 Tax=Sodiomyces alcalophilus JCM 7366 TaxID=591952 RepID=UPI0039B43EC3
MRIGCLQFSPQVGDVDNNLNRADAVLSKANPEELDILILPELAFSGYNFRSLEHISPYLEPSGSGITSLWARTTALKYNCTVTVGYPEKVDVSGKWPTGPEYYNSAIVVNGDGETIANYRKSFLYYTDETWALEGDGGFYEGYIPGLGHTSMGICMDINPYKFEAPWHAFEFAYHILEHQSNFVIVSMAWMTREDGRLFSRMPNEPDMETLTYWVTRLEPLIRAENDEEIIVVFCNRTGTEEEAVYAGTSAVVGIQNGEVKVYGVLGRGQRELLVVDTDSPPYGKLLHRPESEHVASESEQRESGTPHAQAPSQPSSQAPSQSASQAPSQPADQSASHSNISESSNSSTSTKKSKPAPLVHIPPPPFHDPPPSLASQSSTARSPGGDSFDIPTPSAPSPTPMAIRPKLIIPQSPPLQPWQALSPQPQSSQSAYSVHSLRSVQSVHSVQSNQSVRSNERPPAESTPYPDSGVPLSGYPRRAPDVQIYGGHVSIMQTQDYYSPITPFDDLASPMSPSFFLDPTSVSRTPVEQRSFKWPPITKSTLVGQIASRQEAAWAQQNESVKRPSSSHTVRSFTSNNRTRKEGGSASEEQARTASGSPPRSSSKSRPTKFGIDEDRNAEQGHTRETHPPQSSSPKFRNTSRSRNHGRSESTVSHHEAFRHLERFSQRAESTENSRATPDEDKTAFPDRPRSPKSRNCSRSRPAEGVSSILIAASPSILPNSSQATYIDVSLAQAAEHSRPMSRLGHTRSRSVAGRENTQSYGARERSRTPGRKSTRTPSLDRRPDTGFSPPRFVPIETPEPGDLVYKEAMTGLADRRVSSISQASNKSTSSHGSRRTNRSTRSSKSSKSSASCSSKQHRDCAEQAEFQKFESIISPNCPVHGEHPGGSSTGSGANTPLTQEASLVSPDALPVRPADAPDAKSSSGGSIRKSPELSDSHGRPTSEASSQAETLESVSARTPSPPSHEPPTPKAVVIVGSDDGISDPEMALASMPVNEDTKSKCTNEEAAGATPSSNSMIA